MERNENDICESERFQRLFEDYMAGKITSSEIPLSDLIRINKMLEDKIETVAAACRDLENEIIRYELSRPFQEE